MKIPGFTPPALLAIDFSMKRAPKEIIYVEVARGKMEPLAHVKKKAKQRQERVDWLWDKAGAFIPLLLPISLLILGWFNR
jgi:hypothetical protein